MAHPHRVHVIVLAAGEGRRLAAALPALSGSAGPERAGGKHRVEIPDPRSPSARISLLECVLRELAELRDSREPGALEISVVLAARTEPEGRSDTEAADPIPRCIERFGAGVTLARASVESEDQGAAREISGQVPKRSDSIRAGLAVAPDARGWLFVMCDQPLLRACDYARMLDAFEREPDSIACASFGGVRSTPTLFPASLRAELAALRGREGGRQVIARHPGRIRLVELDPERGGDIDTPEELGALFRAAGQPFAFGVDLARRPATMRPPMQRTLSIIKPDAVGAHNTGAILQAIEGAGLRIIGLRMLELSPEQAAEFYAVHRERPFYKSLCDFMISGPIVVSTLEGDDAIARYRKLMGATNPAQADEGTLRKRFATDVERNAVHGSDAPETAAQEIKFFFPELG